MFKRSLELKLYPTKIQKNILHSHLNSCRKLYNSLLDERRWGYRTDRVSITAKYQSSELPKIREEFEEYGNIYSQVLQNVVTRLDRSFKNFFSKQSGFPKYKGKYKFRSITYKQPGAPFGSGGFQFSNDKLKLSFVGNIRTFHKIKPSWFNDKCIPKTCTIKLRSDNNWYAHIIFDVPEENINKRYFGPKPAVGNDLGLTTLSTLSDGTEIANKRFYKNSGKKLARLQRKVSRKQKGSNNRRKSNKKVSKLHNNIANQRKDYLHKVSRNLAKNYGLVAFEDNLDGLSRGFLSKYVLDAGWGTLKRYTKYKCAEEHSEYIEVNKNGTTTDCYKCGFKVPKSLSERIHKCPRCKIEIKRDINSGKIVKQRAIESYLKAPTDCGELTPLEIEPLAASETKSLSFIVELGNSAL